MSRSKLSSGIFGFMCFIFSSPVLALPFCLVTGNGLDCTYQTEAQCEELKEKNQFCVVDPMELNTEQEKNKFLTLPKFGENECIGPLCYNYYLEVCNQEERTVDQPLHCEDNPTP